MQRTARDSGTTLRDAQFSLMGDFSLHFSSLLGVVPYFLSHRWAVPGYREAVVVKGEH